MDNKKIIFGAASAIATVGVGGVHVSAMSVQQIAASAVPVANEYGLYPSVMIAQAILESGGGQSTLASQYNNYFGVKYTSGQGVDMPTTEYIKGQKDTLVQKFQVYASPEESFEAHARLLNSAFYSGATRANAATYADATAYLQGRYATDPNYAQLLNNIINQYDLTAYDGGGAAIAPAQTTSTSEAVSGAAYTVQPGDTLSAIALANGLTAEQLAATNGISTDSILRVGQQLSLGAGTSAPQATSQSGVSSATAATGSYIVQEGDSLWTIAQAHGTSAAALASLNGLSENSVLKVGQSLSISGQSAQAAASTTAAGETASSGGSYTVKAGDTLWAIAQANGMTADQLSALNGLSASSTLAVGQVLSL